MKTLTLELNGANIAVYDAKSYFTRLRGLIGRALAEGEGLMLTPCSQIHTFFMGYAIDVVYLDKQGRVLKIEPEVPPGRIQKTVRGSKHVLELRAKGAAGLKQGDILEGVSVGKEKAGSGDEVDALRERVDKETRFRRVLRGYEPAAVDSYIAELKSAGESRSSELEEQLKALSGRESGLSDSLREKEEKLAAATASDGRSRAALLRREEEISALQTALAERETEIAGLKALAAEAAVSKKSAEERAEQSESACRELSLRLESHDAEAAEAAERIVSLERTLASEKQSRSAGAERMAQLEELLARQTDQIEEFRSERVQALAKRNEDESIITDLKAELERLRGALEELPRIRAEKGDLTAQLAVLRSGAEQSKALTAKLAAENRELHAELENQRKDVKSHKLEMLECLSGIASLSSHISDMFAVRLEEDRKLILEWQNNASSSVEEVKKRIGLN